MTVPAGRCMPMAEMSETAKIPEMRKALETTWFLEMGIQGIAEIHGERRRTARKHFARRHCPAQTGRGAVMLWTGPVPVGWMRTMMVSATGAGILFFRKTYPGSRIRGRLHRLTRARIRRFTGMVPETMARDTETVVGIMAVPEPVTWDIVTIAGITVVSEIVTRDTEMTAGTTVAPEIMTLDMETVAGTTAVPDIMAPDTREGAITDNGQGRRAVGNATIFRRPFFAYRCRD